MLDIIRWCFAATFLALFSSGALAQALQWSVSPTGPTGSPVVRVDTFSVRHSAVADPDGNLFIAGFEYTQDPAGGNPGVSGFFLGKYASADGQELWRFTTGEVAAGNQLTAVALNASGDAFVTGTMHDAQGSFQYVARIAGSTGAITWSHILGTDTTPANSTGIDIALDPSGNPIVLGTHNGLARVTKLDATTTGVIWATDAAFDAGTGQDPVALRVDASGNVYGVTFVAAGSASLIFKLAATGQRLWATSWAYRIAVPGGPEIRDFTIDAEGKPTIAGKGIAKFSQADGSLDWERTLSGTATPSTAFGVTTAANGDVIATGTMGNQGETVVTARLASASGATVWSDNLAGTSTAHGGQAGKSVTLDANGDVLIAAQVFYPDSTSYELQTLNYSADGTQLLMSPRSPVSGTAQADLEISAAGAAYTLGRVLPASGPVGTVALKLAQPRQVSSTLSLTSSVNPAKKGTAITLTAAAGGAAGTPTGTVDFREGGVSLAGCATMTLVNGAAHCVITLSPGTHALEAVYSGDAVYLGTTATLNQAVTDNTATVNLVSSANPSSFQQSVAFTASVTGNAATPTGTVVFFDGRGDISGCALTLGAGSATCTLDGLMPDSHAISAQYLGDASYPAATSAALTQVVQNPPPVPTLAWRASTSDAQPLSFRIPDAHPNIGPRSGVDGAGNLFVVASTSSGTSSCMTVFKRSAADGSIAWRRDTCNPGNDTFGDSLVVDRDGNVLVTGAFLGDLYVAKLSGNTGAAMWERRIAHSAGVVNEGLSIGASAAGDARVAGREGGFLTVHGFSGADGSIQFQRALAVGIGDAFVLSFAVDAAGNSAIGDIHDLDTHAHTESVITRIDNAGAVTWRVPASGTDVAMDAAGNVLTRSGSVERKLDAATGALLWSQSFGGVARVDAQGNIYLVGQVLNADFTTSTTVAKLSASGTVLWSKLFVDDTTRVDSAGLTLDAAGNPVVVTNPSNSQSATQLTMKLRAADGHVEWMASESDPASLMGFAAVHATPTGVVTVGALTSNGSPRGVYAIAYADAVTPPPSTGHVVNLSTRGDVGTGNDVLIGGFVIGGSAAKTVVITAAGPSLASAGIANPLLNPTMTLVRSSDGAVIATNDDWQAAANAAQIQAAGFAPADAREPAIMMTLPPGAYTAVVSGVGNTTGVAVVGVFEVDHPEVPLINISTRGEVLTGNDVMIGGFVIGGSSPQTVVVTGVGPSLTQAGIANALADPTLTLVRADGTVVATNDNWGDAPNAAQVQASGFAPANANEPAIMATLPPGAYTAILRGVGNGTGVGIVAIFRP